VHPTYGMTETASQIATATPEQAFAHPETVGQPLVTTTVRVVDADGSLLNPGETGEIVVDGPTVTPGYLDGTEVDDDGDGTTGPFSKLGFHTGDVGYRDEDGRLYVTGRLDETIVTGGENVQPARVERALESLDAVAAAAVVGVPDDEWGERVTALVVPTGERSHGELDPNELRAATHESLAAHERPKTVVVADSLPRTSSGTVDHDAVRERVTDSD
jgi:O-succinylbenzoic acid--CoA ligase